MAFTERLALIISANPNDAVRGLNKLESTAARTARATESRLDRMGARFTQVGAIMLTAGGVAAAGLFKAGQAAADLEQAVGGTEAVFGEAGDAIDGFASRAATAMGLSEAEFRVATTSIGGNLKRMGLDVSEAADQSVQLAQVAADLAATYGGTTAEAVQALGAAFRGEADPAERFNLNLKIGAVNAKAVELGLAASTSQVSEYARAQATVALIMEQSADAQGQFARETDTASGQMQIAKAELQNFLALVGSEVAPVLADAAGFVSGLARSFNTLPDGVQKTASRFAVLGTGALITAGAVSTVAGQVIKMRDSFTTVSSDGVRSMSKLGKAVGAVGVVGLAYGLVQLGQSLSDTQYDVERFAQASDRQLAASLGTLGPLLAEGSEWAGLFADQLIDHSVPAAERLAEAMEQAGYDTSYLTEKIEAKRDADVQATQDQQEYSDSIAEAAGNTIDAAEATEDLADATEDAADAARRHAQRVDAARDALSAWQEGVVESADAELQMRRATLDTQSAIDGYNETLRDGESTSRDREVAGLDLIDAFLDEAQAARDLAEATAIANGSAESAAREGLQAQLGKLQELAATLAPDSPLRVYLEEFIGRLEVAARPRNATLGLLVDPRAQAFLGYGPDRPGSPGGPLLSLPLSGKNASGGNALAGRAYLVGEGGGRPGELFVPTTSGKVMPIDSGAAAAGSGSPIVLQVMVGGRVVEEVVVDGLLGWQRRNGSIQGVA